MKKLCTLILMLFFAAASLPAMAAEEEAGMGFWFETRAASGGTPAEVVGYYEKSFTDSLGAYAMAYANSSGYREFFVGPKWKPVEWLEVGVGLGREFNPGEPSATRRNAFFSVDRETFSVYGTFENGGSGPWHKVTAIYKASETIGVGVMTESLLGSGPRLEYNVTKKVQVWGAMLRDRDTGKNTSLVAVNFSF